MCRYRKTLSCLLQPHCRLARARPDDNAHLLDCNGNRSPAIASATRVNASLELFELHVSNGEFVTAFLHAPTPVTNLHRQTAFPSNTVHCSFHFPPSAVTRTSNSPLRMASKLQSPRSSHQSCGAPHQSSCRLIYSQSVSSDSPPTVVKSECHRFPSRVLYAHNRRVRGPRALHDIEPIRLPLLTSPLELRSG